MTRVAFYIDFSAETYFRGSLSSSKFFFFEGGGTVSKKCIEYPFVSVGNEIIFCMFWLFSIHRATKISVGFRSKYDAAYTKVYLFSRKRFHMYIYHTL